MRAVRYHQFGGPDQLRLEEVPLPEPGPGEARVRVRAAGLNPVDAKILAGQFAGSEPPKTLGNDFAGVLDEPGGARVFGCGQGFGVRRDGAFAEYVVAPRDSLVPLPEGLSFEQAAALGVVFLTAQLCVEAAGLQARSTVAVFAAGGGVGSAFLQLARPAGARLLAVTSGEGLSRARARGADTIDRTREDVFARLAELAPAGLDVVVDLVGGSWFERAVPLLAPHGRILSVGVTGGEGTRVSVDLPAFYRKGCQLLGINSGLVAPPERAARLRKVAEAFARGALEPPPTESFALESAADALARVARWDARGHKLVLVP